MSPPTATPSSAPTPPAAPPGAVGAREARTFAFIDALRGVAALLVVYFHLHIHIFLGYPTKPIPPGSLSYWFVLGVFDLGKYAVAVFFLISGFLIPSTLASPGAGLKRYVIHRLFRLYPAYWFAILVWIVSQRLMGDGSPLDGMLSRTLLNLTMFQRFFGEQDVIGVFWTLQVELIFYIVCAFLFVSRKLSQRSALVHAALAGGLLIAGARHVTGKGLPVALFLALALMFLGDSLRAYGRQEVSRREVIQLLLAVAVAIVPICALGYGPEAFRYTLTYWAALLTFCGVMRLRTAFEGSRPVHRVLGFFGAISYGVYLLHDPVGLKLGQRVFDATGGNHLFTFVATFGSTIAAAYFTYRFIELPMMALGKRLAARPREHRTDQTTPAAAP